MSRGNKDLHRKNQHYIELLRSYEEIVQELGKKIDTMRQKNIELGPHRRKRKLSNIN